MTQFDYFNSGNFYQNASRFFTDLNIPVNSIEDKAYKTKDFLSKTYNKDSVTHSLIEHIYLIGMVDDDAFSGNARYNSLAEINNVNTDYSGLVIVGVELKSRENKLLPTRTQLAEITRIINREFEYTPVTVLFKYEHYLALANAERTTYVAKHKEGEKVGKVSLLRDINYQETHTGHWQILEGLQISNKIDTFKALDNQWNLVFSVNVLNKKFYQELQNWYYYAIANVSFPGEPTLDDAFLKGKDFKELKNEHNATNVIRMLTRLLFVWFMKEKKLIPEDLFDLEIIEKNILNEIEPYKQDGLFTGHNRDSVYYKAILQNLFFATLNCPIKKDPNDKNDTRERGFRRDKNWGDDQGTDFLLRYKKYFKDPDAFLEQLNSVVPFLNGGLFECLDDKTQNKYIDGFTENKKETGKLVVPDFLFFGLEEEADLSEVMGFADKKTKNAAVKGLLNILKSYKFTVAENTPIEEEVALDPELLGKVFENLLASYNPETKTTARKQTGSFYTPREIVNYMVDESLIAYLKNKIQSEPIVLQQLGKGQINFFGNEHVVGQNSLMEQHSGSELKVDEKGLDEKLHSLVSYNPGNPFKNEPGISRIILEQLDKCTILDPACGSGAFPMGVLQKMTHILEKLDPDNRIWKEVQIKNAKQKVDDVLVIDDKGSREEKLIEINEAFDVNINNPDYARKLFLIENCIYGVDIQPIATQISKLRFFISLVIEQNVDKSKTNFGIRPLPNLETKFVAANTLIGIEKESNLFSIDEGILKLEKELKLVRTKLFSARSKKIKLKYREEDKRLRVEIAQLLINNKFDVASAKKLADWDPYDQNASSPFFDPEWMFDIKEGFNIVIGNPPYGAKFSKEEKALFKVSYGDVHMRTPDSFNYFISKSIKLLHEGGILSFIVPNNLLYQNENTKTRDLLLNNNYLKRIINLGDNIFENADVPTCIFVLINSNLKKYDIAYSDYRNKIFADIDFYNSQKLISKEEINQVPQLVIGISAATVRIMRDIAGKSFTIDEIALEVASGISTGSDKVFRVSKDFVERNNLEEEILRPVLVGGEIDKYRIQKTNHFIIYTDRSTNLTSYSEIEQYIFQYKDVLSKRSEAKSGIMPWYSLNRQRYPNLFEENKIIMRQTSDSIRATLDLEGFYCIDSILIFKIKEQYEISLKYALLSLNSKMNDLLYKNITQEVGRTFAQVKPQNVRKLFIPKISLEEQKVFEILCDYLLYLNDTESEPISTRISNKVISRAFEDLADACIVETIYSYEMKQQNVEILDLVKGITDGLSNMDVDIKQQITDLFVNLTSSTSEVRNRLKLMSLKCPDTVGKILSPNEKD